MRRRPSETSLWGMKRTEVQKGLPPAEIEMGKNKLAHGSLTMLRTRGRVGKFRTSKSGDSSVGAAYHLQRKQVKQFQLNGSEYKTKKKRRTLFFGKEPRGGG